MKRTTAYLYDMVHDTAQNLPGYESTIFDNIPVVIYSLDGVWGVIDDLTGVNIGIWGSETRVNAKREIKRIEERKTKREYIVAQEGMIKQLKDKGREVNKQSEAFEVYSYNLYELVKEQQEEMRRAEAYKLKHTNCDCADCLGIPF